MAAVDYFLKLDGIPGESTDSKHKGEIDVLSWSWGTSQQRDTHSGGGAGLSSGKVHFADMTLTAKMCKASPKLKLACCSGQHIKNGILTCRKAGKDQQEYLVIKLETVLVTSWHTSGGGGEDMIPTDSISIAFAKIEMQYKEQKDDGTLGGAVNSHWSVKENKGG